MEGEDERVVTGKSYVGKLREGEDFMCTGGWMRKEA